MRLGYAGLICAFILAMSSPAGANSARAVNGQIFSRGFPSSVDAFSIFGASPTDPHNVTEVDVLNRNRPDYDPKGISWGSFRVFPALFAGAAYDSNVFRQSSGAKADALFDLGPSIDIQSQWTRHALDLFASLDWLNYNSLQSENQANWNAGFHGRLDIIRGAAIYANATYSALHELRNSPDLPGFAVHPTPYRLFNSDISIVYQPGRLLASIGVNFQRLEFGAVPAIPPAPIPLILNNDRDREVDGAFAKLAYEIASGSSVFVRGSYLHTNFDLPTDRSGTNRDSTAYRVNGGADLLFTDLLRGEIYVGYLTQDYRGTIAVPLAGVRGLDYGVGLTWFATPLITVNLSATKTVNETTLTGASGSDEQTIRLDFNYELARNVVIQVGASYTDFRFVGISRHDSLPEVQVGLEYLFNRYLSAKAQYQFTSRASNLAGQDFSDSTLSVGLTAHL